ncbi:hypothetical protein GCM10025867_17150 [Frondihabitans sucicola]|uniref:Uncharacterized protein n=1 Tax=Frondihabitans sucicola TaxID=1268041 RepID=A0ABM8GM33_9MICO|nr:hypothetical protein [Frondihabitans sucicola]BDZ49474.1 hypothetical protein GCM10025867_17150 [Frondihabitans sucicola]
MPEDEAQPARIELILSRPPVGWFPKPTVVVGGRGQPAQWGTGTWQVEPGATIGVYLFNRVWRFGAAELVAGGPGTTLRYRAPWLPFGPGRLTSVA